MPRSPVNVGLLERRWERSFPDMLSPYTINTRSGMRVCIPMFMIGTGRNDTLLAHEKLVHSLLTTPGKHMINSFKTLEGKLPSISLIHTSEFSGCFAFSLVSRETAISSPGWRQDSIWVIEVGPGVTAQRAPCSLLLNFSSLVN